MNWFTHYIVNDFYSPVWPNLAASAITATVAVKRIRTHLKRHRAWQSQHFKTIHANMNTIHSAVASSHSHEAIVVEPRTYVEAKTGGR